MCSLMAAIPGLSAHAVSVPEPVVSFDALRADELLRELNDAIGAAYPDSGCLPWLAKEQPLAWTSLCEGENAVDRAYLAGDMAALEKAADLLKRMYLKAFSLYTLRPPVVEVQERLL